MPATVQPVRPRRAPRLFGLIALMFATRLLAGGPEFSTPLNVIGLKDIAAGPGITPGDILELRAGPGADQSSFNVAALLRGPGNTTAINVLNVRRIENATTPGSLDINAIPVSAISNVQAFSLGGGCRSGASALFPFLQNNANNFRPYLLRVTNGTPSVTPLAIAGTDNIHSIDCVTDANGQDVYYAVANATQSRAEVWKSTAGNPPTSIFTNLQQLLSPFSGGTRVLMASIENTFFGNVIIIQYQRTDGQIANYAIRLTPVSLAATCLLFTQSPVPNSFTVVREGRIISLRGLQAIINSATSASDPDRNGTAELVRTPIQSCAPTLVNKGSSAGGNGFTWTGYGAISNSARGWGYVGNGNSLFRVDIDSAATQNLVVPPLGPGGPYDFVGGTYADNKAFGFYQIGTKPGAPREVRFTLSVEYKGDGNFAADFEGASLDRASVFNQ